MARNGKTPSRAKAVARLPARDAGRMMFVQDLLLAAKGMGSNSFSFTLVAILALIAVIAVRIPGMAIRCSRRW